MRSVADLTKKQLRVLTLTVRGWNHKEIADYLGVSTATVGVHRSNIYSRLNVRNATELAVWYWKFFNE